MDFRPFETKKSCISPGNIKKNGCELVKNESSLLTAGCFHNIFGVYSGRSSKRLRIRLR